MENQEKCVDFIDVPIIWNTRLILTVPQVAQALGIGTNTAYRLVKERAIGSKHIGRKIIVPKACLVDYVLSARYTVSDP